MGSATSQALAAARASLATRTDAADLGVAKDLLAAGRLIGDSSPLKQALTDPDVLTSEKDALINGVFSKQLSAVAVSILTGLAHSRWSRPRDILEGIEDIGFRVAAASVSDGADLDREIFAFSQIVSSNSELELALGSKLSSNAAKETLIERLLGGNASEAAVVIVQQVVAQPRGRRIGASLAQAARIVADQAGSDIATVTSAVALSEAQLGRLTAGLASQYGRPVRVNSIVDPAIRGGVRVQIGDNVIDGSVVSRLNDLRLRLAG